MLNTMPSHPRSLRYELLQQFPGSKYEGKFVTNIEATGAKKQSRQILPGLHITKVSHRIDGFLSLSKIS